MNQEHLLPQVPPSVHKKSLLLCSLGPPPVQSVPVCPGSFVKKSGASQASRAHSKTRSAFGRTPANHVSSWFGPTVSQESNDTPGHLTASLGFQAFAPLVPLLFKRSCCIPYSPSVLSVPLLCNSAAASGDAGLHGPASFSRFRPWHILKLQCARQRRRKSSAQGDALGIQPHHFQP
jgi:hypothetical protein